MGPGVTSLGIMVGEDSSLQEISKAYFPAQGEKVVRGNLGGIVERGHSGQGEGKYSLSCKCQNW